MIPISDNTPRRTWPMVNFLLIGLNIWAFVLELRQPDPKALEAFIMQWGLVPKTFLAFPVDQWMKLFTSMFLHGGWSHIIGNMLYLWIFGDNVEDKVGHFRYILFYLLAGTGAAMAQVLSAPASSIPMLGASGAIAGVMGAYFVLFPRARVMTLVPIFFFYMVRAEIPAMVFLGIWFLVQTFQGYGSLLDKSMQGGVAWWAHAGGFISGIFLLFVFKKR